MPELVQCCVIERCVIEPSGRSVETLVQEGWSARSRDQADVAHDLFVAAYQLAEKENDDLGKAHALVALADNAFHFCPYKDADLWEIRSSLADYALQLFRSVDHEKGIAAALRVLASVSSGEDCVSRLEQSLAICKKIGNVEGIIDSLQRLGNQAALSDNAGEATRLKRKALKLARELGDQEVLADSLWSTAIGFDGSDTERRSLLEEAQKIYGQLGQFTRQARTLQFCAILACGESDWQRKAEYLERALSVTRRSQHASTLCSILDPLIDVCRELGDVQRADLLAAERETLHDPLELSDEVRDALDEAFATEDNETAMTAVRKWIFGSRGA